MKRASPTVDAVRAILAEYFELFLTTVGVLLAILVTLSELSAGSQDMSLIFLIWLQGFILWAVHRHCRLRSLALFEQIRLRLQDRMDYRITVLRSIVGLNAHDRADDQEGALEVARAVSREIENLSFESLSIWERRHARRPTNPDRRRNGAASVMP